MKGLQRGALAAFLTVCLPVQSSETNRLTVPQSLTFHEGGGGSSVLRDAIRLQQVYMSDQFPQHPIIVRELRWRPSAVHGRAFDGRLERLQLKLSTTAKQPRSLERVFARNIGLDETLVFDGPVDLGSAYVGPAKGPKEFDIAVVLQTPFPFDPRIGNLLVDICNHVSGPITFVDAGRSSRVGRVFSLGAESTMGTVGDHGGDCMQLCYTDSSSPPLAPGTGMLVNGSFEVGIDPGTRANLIAHNEATIPGWKIESGVVDYLSAGSVAGDGGRFVGLRDSVGTCISQMISGLSSGRWYEISFLAALNPEVRKSGTELCISVGSVSNRFSFAGSTDVVRPAWHTNYMTFQAVGVAAPLRLTSRGAGLAGPMIDGLKITALEGTELRRPVSKWHDLAGDFNPASNPAGPWRLGWKGSLGGPMTLLTSAREVVEQGRRCAMWQASDRGGATIGKAIDGAKGDRLGFVTAIPGKVEEEERICVARFTVPVGGAGQYWIEATGTEVSESSSKCGAEFRLLHNEREIFGRLLAPGLSAGFTRQVRLKEGETLDVAVGPGWNLVGQGAAVELGVRVGLLEPGEESGTADRLQQGH